VRKSIIFKEEISNARSVMDAPVRKKPEFHLRVVQEISELINRCHILENILEGVVQKIKSSLHFDVVSIYLYDPNKDVLVLRACQGLKWNTSNPITMKPDEGLTGFVFQTRRSLSVLPASKHPRYRFFPESGEQEYESYIGVPILLENKCLGVLVGQYQATITSHEAEEILFEIIASRLASVLVVGERLERLRRSDAGSGNLTAKQGKGLSGGYATGEVFLLKRFLDGVDFDSLTVLSPVEEGKRFNKAVEATDQDLVNLIGTLESDGALSREEVAIFRSQRSILKDPMFQGPVLKRIRDQKMVAEKAVSEGVESLVKSFEALGEYFQERKHDLRDLEERMIRCLLGARKEEIDENSFPPVGCILAGFDISASFLASLPKNHIKALVSEVGGVTSHMAIIARSLGIPAITGIKNIYEYLKDGDDVLVDGKAGFLFIHPDASLTNEYRKYEDKLEKVKRYIVQGSNESHISCIMARVSANIGLPSDVEKARDAGIQDVGLFRTEFSFMRKNSWPSIAEQYEIYKEVSNQFSGYVTIRTLDIGADKTLPYFTMAKEENPLMGLRSIRFSMEYLEYFKDQIQAVLQVAKEGKKLRILLPMVTHYWEVKTARDIMFHLAFEMGLTPDQVPKLGLMVEVPGVLYQLDDYKEMVDFFSVGTNDLIQYLLAVDRGSALVGHLYSESHPTVVRFLYEFLQKANGLGKPLSICGEMAATPVGILILLALGYRDFSVVPSKMHLIRFLCNRLSEAELERIRLRILKEPQTKELKYLLQDELNKLDPVLLEVE
jgi:phosphotransferase system, enzyme I, PtsP